MLRIGGAGDGRGEAASAADRTRVMTASDLAAGGASASCRRERRGGRGAGVSPAHVFRSAAARRDACPTSYASRPLMTLPPSTNLDRAAAGGHQLLVGDDAELVIDGRGQVFGADRRRCRARKRWRSTCHKSVPPLMPPPASITLNTFGQWSRPAVWLIFGVRPNSLLTMTSVVAKQARACRGP